MTDFKEQSRKLHLVLAEAHRQKQKGRPRPSRNWRNGLMNSLPALGVLEQRIGQWAFLERLVWRLVPAAGALTLFLAILVGHVGPDRTTELARLISADSTSSDLYTFYQREHPNE